MSKSTATVTVERTLGELYAADQRWCFIVWRDGEAESIGYERTRREAEREAWREAYALTK
jgi:hypothetical protein